MNVEPRVRSGKSLAYLNSLEVKDASVLSSGTTAAVDKARNLILAISSSAMQSPKSVRQVCKVETMGEKEGASGADAATDSNNYAWQTSRQSPVPLAHRLPNVGVGGWHLADNPGSRSVTERLENPP